MVAARPTPSLNRYLPDVQGQEKKTPKLAKVQRAGVGRVGNMDEMVEDTAEVTYHTANVLRGGQNPALRLAAETVVATEMCEEEDKKGRNTKYFCRSCNTNICNSCFSISCLSHKVQWMPFSGDFTCGSSLHKAPGA